MSALSTTADADGPVPSVRLHKTLAEPPTAHSQRPPLQVCFRKGRLYFGFAHAARPFAGMVLLVPIGRERLMRGS